LDAACTNDIKSSAGDPYVHVDHGYMVVLSQMIPAQILHTHHPWAYGDRRGAFKLRIGVDPTDGSARLEYLDFPGPHFLADYDLAAAGASCVSHENLVFCLRLAEIPKRNVEASLVLRCTDDAEKIYERIGILFAPISESSDLIKEGKRRDIGRAKIFDTESLMDAIFAMNMEDVGGPKWFMSGDEVRDIYANAGDAVVAIIM